MIRPAVPDDVPTLVGFIHDLAEFERSPQSVHITPGQLRDALFASSPAVFAHVAEEQGQVVGMAIWFLTFSTWTGRHGIHLEDLYVRPESRTGGVGRALLSELATIARRSGYARVEWSVLDWNENALSFYRSLGAEPLDEWVGYRLSGAALASLGSQADLADVADRGAVGSDSDGR
jgi:GNAT superfamily N-acetyltransferase